MESIQDYTVGTIRFHNFFAEFTAYGVVQTKLQGDFKLHYNKSVSLRSLYAKENQVYFARLGSSELKISFFVDGMQMAWADVTAPEIGEVALTRGSCVWTWASLLSHIHSPWFEISCNIFAARFDENSAVDEVEASIINNAEKIFSIPNETFV